MTYDEHQQAGQNSSGTPPRKRQRMGQWQTLGSDDATPPPPQHNAIQREEITRAPSEQAEHQSSEGSKQRMGQSAAPKQRMGSSSSKQRMGASAASPQTVEPSPQRMGASAPKQRMGAPAPKRRMSGAGAETPEVAGAQPTQAEPTAPVSTVSDSAVRTSDTSQPTHTARPRWVRPVMAVVGIVLVALVVVLAARWLRTLEPVQAFIETYDGHATQPETAPVGIPAWLGWQHFLNMFFIVLIIRTGIQVRTEKRPPGMWKPKKNSFFSPKGNTPKKVSLSQWLHQTLDVFWVLNGVIFVVLLAVSGHWMRIVPTHWDIFPNMLSGMIQYASLDWPLENGWIHYNALQVFSYFLIVYVAAPLAILTGWRISTWWPTEVKWLNRIYPVEAARKLHFPVMLFFVAFTIVHVFLVFFTGALRNLNHMYTARDVTDWWGLIIFLGSVAGIAAAWFLTKPLFVTPIANKMGAVTKN